MQPGKNLGKYDRLALAECIDLVVRGTKNIFYNGVNQVKTQCGDKEDANTLVRSQELMRGGFKLFIPSSLLRKKTSTGPIDPKYSAADIVCKLDPAVREAVVAIRRRTNEDGSTSARVEFTMAVSRVPHNLRIMGYSYPLTPVIPPPRRCFACQRFRHISNQCRSSRPIMEFCSEHHHTDACPNRLPSAFCSNCCGDHLASSRDCPVYQYEFEVSKYCCWNGCGFGEADLGLRERGTLRPGLGPNADIDRASLGVPSSFLRGLGLDPGPSVSVSIASGQVSALEVTRSLLDLGWPPVADPPIDALGGMQCPVPSMATLSCSPSGSGAGLSEARAVLNSGLPRLST